MKILFVSTLLTLSILLNKQVLAAGSNWEQIYANPFVTSVETTPWGIAMGEYISIVTPTTFNGIYLSKDLGVTWQQMGLNGRGVRDIKYFDNKIYAATYHWKDDTVGIFVSEDRGKTWEHLGNNFSTATIDRDAKSIYVGGFSHGLWVSKDEGLTWVQKIGDGLYGPTVETITSSEGITIASTPITSYKSNDSGETWTEIIALRNQNVKSLNIKGRIIFAVTAMDLYRSTDFGTTWEKLGNFGNPSYGSIIYFSDSYYAGRLNDSGNGMTIYRSLDNGTTWEDTYLSIQAPFARTLDIASLFSIPSYLFTAQSSFGIYRYKIPQEQSSTTPFLRTPWNNKKENEFIDKIYSFFDHTYPLLGYTYYQEPVEERVTTLNFLGKWGYMPDMFYSSHDGYDYTLPYGTEIVAPSSGFASYYYCNACGNAIKINHLNGYQTQYFHFQKEGLITTTNEPIWVEEGEVIGKVGMTGNTTGPHLHYAVVKDTDDDGMFEDELPCGKTDPYSWKNSFYVDPWELFTWTDNLGTHKGIKSPYLWKTTYPSIADYTTVQSEQLSLDNKTLLVEPQLSEKGITIGMKPYITPIISNAQEILSYVGNTSVIIEAFDHFGTKITTLNAPFSIKISYTDADIENIIPETMKLYIFDETEKLWRPLPTIINLASKYLSAEGTHLSQFAVLGEKVQATIPTTEVQIGGELENGWYKTYPLITLISQAKTYYSISETELWQEYIEPFVFESEGTTNLYYRSMDTYGNIEDTQKYIIKVDTSNSWKKTVKVTGSTFNVQ